MRQPDQAQLLADPAGSPTPPPASPLAPLPRRAPRLTVVARDQATCRGAVLGWAPGWRALASASVPAGAELGADLHELKQALSAALPSGEKLPRSAILLSSEVVGACVELPGHGRLPPERTETLLGWELEPFLPPEPEPGPTSEGQAEVACGWARVEGRGPLLACGLRPHARDAARAAFTRAGLRLKGLYPSLGCAAAELEPAAGSTVVLELGRGAVSTQRIERGRVVAARVARCAVGGEVDLALSLLPREATLWIAGPVPAELREALLGEPWSELPGPAAEDPLSPSQVPASWAGAARHALG
ncbi:MAG TPA: hypothetical protein DEA08_11955, partial [Planctomycetes bacterium]|nr:hypothetical protein [Planctomycetota bacterium]